MNPYDFMGHRAPGYGPQFRMPPPHPSQVRWGFKRLVLNGRALYLLFFQSGGTADFGVVCKGLVLMRIVHKQHE